MAWKYGDRTIRVGKAWSDANLQHPYNWHRIWSDSDKANFGLTYEEDVDVSYDSRFYYAKDIERPISDYTAIADSGDTIGLKTQYIATTKVTANSLLQSTDWYAVRKMEDSSKNIPSNIATYRSNVRTASGTIESSINAVSNLTEFKALFNIDSDGISPINNWPEQV
jgi:hypothetical protein